MARAPDEALRAARESGELPQLLGAIPYLRLIGLSAEAREGDLVVHMPGDPRLIGNPVLPALHGGTVGALLESTAILKLLWETDILEVPKTITLTVDYLRSARLADTWARASITRFGRRVANVQIRAWQEQEDRPIAVAHAHFLLRSPQD
ncbi:MAG: PaaI family thioesterase [Polyangiales bacterium]